MIASVRKWMRTRRALSLENAGLLADVETLSAANYSLRQQIRAVQRLLRGCLAAAEEKVKA